MNEHSPSRSSGQSRVSGPDHLIVLPGGGYVALADHEAEPIVEWLTGLGLSASVFRYPVQTRHPAPTRAIHEEIARVRAAGATRVGLVGFSAGGHAAAQAALSVGEEAHGGVDVVILGYPVVSMTVDAHEGSRTSLLGPDSSEDLRVMTSVELQVDGSAPPFFVWHTAADTAVTPSHALRLATSLAEHGIPYELHIYERGNHGVGLAEGLETAQQWTMACEAWLRSRDWIRTS